MKRQIPDGDYAALGARVIAQSECGNYSEDSLTVWKLSDAAVVIERIYKDGRTQRWRVEPTDTLRVSGEAYGGVGAVGLDSFLTLVPLEGKEVQISHFEWSSSWGGGQTDDDVAKLARAIALEASCSTKILPFEFPGGSAVYSPSPVPASVPMPVVVDHPRRALLGELPGGAVLGTLVCGEDSTEPLSALQLSDGSVLIENATTGARWPIMREDVLVITAYDVAGGPGGVWTVLERARTTGVDRIATFRCWNSDHKGPGENTVVAFVSKIVMAAACQMDHRPYVWG